jgi:Spy/CpxP family protein refolding chaperone
MKNSRLVLLIALVAGSLLAASPLAFAKRARAGAAAAAKKGAIRDHLEKIAEELNLTPDQREKLKPIVQDAAQKFKSLRKDTSLTRQQLHTKSAELRKELIARVKPILTPEQVEKWLTLHQKNGAKLRKK